MLTLIRNVLASVLLLIAIYFSNESIHSWNESPIVTSVKLRSIKKVPFPAVTICHDIDAWKWSSISAAMAKLDSTGLISEGVNSFHQDHYGTNVGSLQNSIIVVEVQAFRKSKEYKEGQDKTSLKYVEDVIPQELQDVAKLMHFITFGEQNVSSSWKLRDFFQACWYGFSKYKLSKNGTLDKIGSDMKDDICAGKAYSRNVTKYCLDWNETDDEVNSTILWSHSCSDQEECLKSTLATNFKKTMTYMILIERLYKKEHLVDYLVQIGVNRYEPQRFEELMKISMNGTSTISAWNTLNGGHNAIQDNFLKSITLHNETYDLTQEQKLDWTRLFSVPLVQGNNQEDYVIAPLCSFGGNINKMKRCSLFKQSSFSIGKQRCHTFNGNESNPELGPGLQGGLNMFLSFRFPKDKQDSDVESYQLILHEPGVQADLHFRANTFLDIKPGKEYIIGTEAIIMESTESFKSLSEPKRGCKLGTKVERYHQTNCYFESLINYGIKQCQCIPWYMYHQVQPPENICVLNGFSCFENVVKNETIQMKMLENCPVDCNFIKYTPNILEKETFKREAYDYDEVKADVLGEYLESTFSYVDAPYQSMVQINFASPHATVMTQDAKVTFSDSLGTIGGTFGVFMGLSIVGLLDKMIDWLQHIHRIVQIKS